MCSCGLLAAQHLRHRVTSSATFHLLAIAFGPDLFFGIVANELFYGPHAAGRVLCFVCTSRTQWRYTVNIIVHKRFAIPFPMIDDRLRRTDGVAWGHKASTNQA